MPSSTDFLLNIVRAQKQGRASGVYAICSANRFVLEAGMQQALADRSVVCIESTSNQVNQFGGYTGMTAADFARFVKEVATAQRFPTESIILGGDHLGPHCWQKESAAQAMSKARELIKSCVLAGYTKIHLDASMRCADDAGGHHAPLQDEIVAERAADLCAVAEAAHAQLPKGSPKPVYVIGTEVPVPGGEQKVEAGPAVTKASDVERTIQVARAAFAARKLEQVWERVIALVVQPGVEFADAQVFEYSRPNAAALKQAIRPHATLVYEAHSTDYQTAETLKQLVEDHFAVLKVGPWLTFAFREAVFALAQMEAEWLQNRALTLSRLRESVEQVMLSEPKYWQPYYHGDDNYLGFARKYSFSDRSRYYWPRPELASALKTLIANLSANPLPLTLLSQYLPKQYDAVRAGKIRNHPLALIQHKIREVNSAYAYACGGPRECSSH